MQAAQARASQQRSPIRSWPYSFESCGNVGLTIGTSVCPESCPAVSALDSCMLLSATLAWPWPFHDSLGGWMSQPLHRTCAITFDLSSFVYAQQFAASPCRLQQEEAITAVQSRSPQLNHVYMSCGHHQHAEAPYWYFFGLVS